jgi:hypothetical protein
VAELKAIKKKKSAAVRAYPRAAFPHQLQWEETAHQLQCEGCGISADEY